MKQRIALSEWHTYPEWLDDLTCKLDCDAVSAASQSRPVHLVDCHFGILGVLVVNEGVATLVGEVADLSKLLEGVLDVLGVGRPRKVSNVNLCFASVAHLK